MKKHKHLARKIFLAVLLVLWASVVIYSQVGLNKSSASKLTTIKIGYLSGDEIAISKARGALKKKMKKQGYNVVFKEFSSGAEEVQALASGSIDYARCGDTPPVTALAAGSKLAYIATGGTKAKGTGLLVKKSSGIKTIADLKGKKIAYTKSTASEYFIRALLSKYGLKTSDVQLVNLETSAASIAYSKGKVSAIVAWDPTTSQLEASGSTLLYTGEDVSYNNRSYIMSTQKFAKKNQAVSQLLIKYLSQDMTWANKHQKKLTKILVKALGLKESVVKKMISRRSYDFGAVTQTAIKESQSMADTFYKAGVIKTDPKISKYVISFK